MTWPFIAGDAYNKPQSHRISEQFVFSYPDVDVSILIQTNFYIVLSRCYWILTLKLNQSKI